ncbi:MAG: peptidoglycan DD-metalloendopeptidase family protein [Pseudoflavonifractor sp.]|nr:peptidoglycan DD-metalloendopeptidase family protein [Pseudoflavonifractor sp.]
MRKTRQIIVAVIAAVMLALPAAEAARNVNRVKRDRQKTTQEIKKTAKEIEENQRQTRKQLNQLNMLQAEVQEKNATIADMQVQVDSINRGISRLNDSIEAMERHLELLRSDYASAVRAMQSHRSSMNTLAFIFSSESFTQAYRRMRYLRQFSQWRARRSGEITAAHDSLAARRAELARMHDTKNHSLIQLNVARRELQGKQKQTEVLVADLKKQGSTLQAVLKKKEQEARALDQELDRLIAEQQRKAEEERKRRLAEERARKEREAKEAAERAERERKEREENERLLAEQSNADNKTDKKGQDTDKSQKSKNKKDKNKPVRPDKRKNNKDKSRKEQPAVTPTPAKGDMASVETPSKSVARDFDTADADRALSGSFESNKGRLLFPVSGKYKIVRHFGRQRHADLPYVQTDNGGIDIEVPAGGMARAIFAGKVSAIFRQPGFNTIVMVRHGNYLTIYANLSDISVKTGDTVKANQTIGRIFSDPDDDGRSIMHFELRKEKAKLNPEQWVR